MTKLSGMPPIPNRPKVPEKARSSVLTERGLARTISCMQAEIAGRRTTLEMLTSIAMTVGCLDLPLVQRIMWECNEHWTLRLATRGETQPALTDMGLYNNPWLPQVSPHKYLAFLVIGWAPRTNVLENISEETHLNRLREETGIVLTPVDFSFYTYNLQQGVYDGNYSTIEVIRLDPPSFHHYSDDL